jgi:catechol 2,3-dioxygenase-like lactoylglutathione lyase family enzyme
LIVGLDHVSVATADLDTAAKAYAKLLGVAPQRGEADGIGRYARFELANMALVLFQHDGADDGLWSLALRADDEAETRRVLERRGLGAGSGPFLDTAATAGLRIAIVEHSATPVDPPTPDAVEALDHVVVRTANPDRAVALWGARLGLDFRLDRSNPVWGSRLLFFRCGGAVIEVGAALEALVTDAPDTLSGLAWRVRDPAAAHARIAAAGFDVSEVRKGRKPGTAVFTLRSGLPAAPALVIGGS